MNELQQEIEDRLEGRPLVINAIIASAALAFGLTPADLLSRDRHKSIAEARCCVCFVARQCTRMSYPQIGKALGRDHTSVMSAVKRVEKLRMRDEWFAAAVSVLLERFDGSQEKPIGELRSCADDFVLEAVG